jgi:hypothetical protein
MTCPLLAALLALTPQTSVPDLPPEPSSRPAGPDWLVDPAPYRAALWRSSDGRGVVLANGLVRREIALDPGVATVALDELRTGRAVLRAVEPEARVTIDGVALEVGGLDGQTNRAFLTPQVRAALTAVPDALRLTGVTTGVPEAPFEWKRVRHHDERLAWPPTGVALELTFAHPEHPGIGVTVHHELYDGLPCLAKWITVTNTGSSPFTVDAFTSEILAAVERESRVESRPGVHYPPPNLWVETDFACGGSAEEAQRFAVHWGPDPAYTSQVSYRLETPCLLECRPTVGPSIDVAPGETFTSFRTFLLVLDSEDRARNGLARCRMLRTLAPWTTESPLMMHVRQADPASVELALEQCAEVGFEMVILTFGSGFDLEDERPETLARWRALADRARELGLDLGGYSLFSSRSIGPEDDVVSPAGTSPTFGHAPALAGRWGRDYMRKLYAFFPATGFTMLEHDGPYPGDLDAAARPPLQKGLEDSRWVQFWIAADFYRWCRGQGVFLNTPDWYLLNGSTKSAMGYREVNWSLPRAEQVLHSRQNLYDGTWTKPPTAGWMFVPLTEYHGGGAAATVEPLDEHREHYGRMLDANLGAGAQACYRGPRLYDTDATRELVRERVSWFRAHREVLEGDIDHAASRRADGRDLDWLLHVRPGAAEAGALVVYNPRDVELERTLRLDVWATGLRDRLTVHAPDGQTRTLSLIDGTGLELSVRVPAGAMQAWFLSPAP